MNFFTCWFIIIFFIFMFRYIYMLLWKVTKLHSLTRLDTHTRWYNVCNWFVWLFVIFTLSTHYASFFYMKISYFVTNVSKNVVIFNFLIEFFHCNRKSYIHSDWSMEWSVFFPVLLKTCLTSTNKRKQVWLLSACKLKKRFFRSFFPYLIYM